MDAEILNMIKGLIMMGANPTRYGDSIFACSFCKLPNELSLWRAYCPQGNGFSIGFNLSELQGIIREQHFRITECIYDKDKQWHEIENYLNGSLASYHEAAVTNRRDVQQKAERKIYTDFLQIAATLKDPAFHDEKEWRLISEPVPPTFSSGKDSPVKFREGTLTIIPYFKLMLAGKDRPFNIPKLYIGPTQHEDLACNAVSNLLFTNGITECPIELSKIPYRITTY